MRLFAAVVPPPAVLDEVESLVAPLRRDQSVRWSPRELWHVTCAFYGEAGPEVLADLTDGLTRAAERSPVDALRLLNATEFNGRALALEIVGDTEGLGELARRCTGAGRDAGLRMEHRRYRPHLTVARTPRPRDLSQLVTALIGARSIDWRPDALVLLHSHRGSNARYDEIARWALPPIGSA